MTATIITIDTIPYCRESRDLSSSSLNSTGDIPPNLSFLHKD